MVVLVGLLLSLTGTAQGKERLIVKFADQQLRAQMLSEHPQPGRLIPLGRETGLIMRQLRPMSGGFDVVTVEGVEDAEQALEILRRHPAIRSVEIDRRVYPMVEPNDPLYAKQWALQSVDPSIPRYGIDMPAAWDRFTGENNPVRVAVIDTGLLLDHPDIAGRWVGGYDFISNEVIANDGDGRDDNPSDPGDWVSEEDRENHSEFENCPVSDSSWHGTLVAGIIAAASNNGEGIAGIQWGGPAIVPVRVLGKCTGFLSDLVDAMTWSVGLAVPGVPKNPYPARILNVSLGAYGRCDESPSMRAAVEAVHKAGGVIVAAAGNDNKNLDDEPMMPASCEGVLVITATGKRGQRAWYANFGSSVTLAAPGGDDEEKRSLIFSTADKGILSTSNNGTREPEQSNYEYVQGTSFAVPHVSGVISLMLGINPELTRHQITQILTETATPFPTYATKTDLNCSTDLCGAGILNAGQALARVQDGPLPSPEPEPEPEPEIKSAPSGGGGAFSLPGLIVIMLVLLFARRHWVV